MARIATKRLQKEMVDIVRNPPVGVTLLQSDDLQRWVVNVDGAEDSLYKGETFKLQFKFANDYPIEAPEVIFLSPIPLHPHIYSNGHIVDIFSLLHRMISHTHA